MKRSPAPRGGRTTPPRPAAPRGAAGLPRGLWYDRRFVSAAERAEILAWLATIHPLWEQRYAPNHPPPPGREQRGLLRPVYWLGNWQFACLDYYRPPRGVHDRCVRAEPFPPVLARLVARAEKVARGLYRGPDLPAGWHLNTCLVNFYGSRVEEGRLVDTARVGDHKDFEPGPVASISLGERAWFQFTSSRRVGQTGAVEFEQWLDDGSLQVFGGERWKNRTFHRVQRVEKKGASFELDTPGFVTRRVNFTFRYVPDEHVVRFADLSPGAADDVRGYMQELARRSEYFRTELAARPAA